MESMVVKEKSLTCWLDYILSIHPAEIDMGLERVSSVAERMSLLHLTNGKNLAPKIITVAGTNGKGTTCTMLEQILLASGLRVGVYSSPHILKFNERVRVDLKNVLDCKLVEAFNAIELARKNTSLTFFEFATLAALYVFKLEKLDVIILEVGLGGRLDATNMIDADVSVITAIGVDHQNYLGDTRELIGLEKAGIFRTNKLAIIGEPDLPNSVVNYAKEQQVPLYSVGKDFNYKKNKDGWQFTGAKFSFNELCIPRLPLANAATVLAILEQLRSSVWSGLSESDCQRFIDVGLSKAYLEGRFEKINESPNVYLDVAHNPHAAKYLASQLYGIKAKLKTGRLFALCGMLKDKDIKGVFNEVMPCVDKWFLTGLDCERGANIELIEHEFLSVESKFRFDDIRSTTSYQAHKSIDDAWHALKLQINADDVVIVFGSFYTVSGAKLLMNRK